MTAYQPKTLPVDGDGFVQAFSLDDTAGLQSFFEEYGFVVVDGVLGEAARADTIREIWATIEGCCGGRLNIDRDDPSSWRRRWPGGGPGLLGQAVGAAAWRNRANPSLRAVFEHLVGRSDLVCSVDNYGVLRPTRRVPMHRLPPQAPSRTDVVVAAVAGEAGGSGATGGSGSRAAAMPLAPAAAAGAVPALPEPALSPAEPEEAAAGGKCDGGGRGGPGGGCEAAAEDMPSWKTKSRWLHWDLSPFHWAAGTMPPYAFTPYTWISENNGTPREPRARAKVQGLLNLVDARAEDGGFLCVPGFHAHLTEWVALPQNRACKESAAAGAFDYLEVPPGDPMHGWAQPVPMRAGSLLVWNSELPHCNFHNDSERFRMVQYVKCFPCPEEPAPGAAAAAAPSVAGFGATTVGLAGRRAAIAAWTASSLGAEQVAALTDEQRAMLGLQDYAR